MTSYYGFLWSSHDLELGTGWGITGNLAVATG